jgi:formate dehydrogenase major subunit
MKIPKFTQWPVLKQIQSGDPHALGHNTMSERTRALESRTRKADRVVKSVCPYCAVGCAQLVYVKGERILDIEGDPDSPISRGCLCPKGSATFQLVTSSRRVTNVLYRPPYGTEWQVIPLDQAMEMVAQRIKTSRDENWQAKTEAGEAVNRTLSVAHLGGATWDNEENYLLKKLYCALGIVQVENQARV